MGKTIFVTKLTNREFLERYAGTGRIGLAGGTTPIDKAICRAQRHLNPQHRWGIWSHAFVFEGLRADGHHWVLESDLQFHRKNIQLGVQENRVTKFHDESLYGSLAVLDFGLTPAQVDILVREGLEMVANHEKYSVRELFGTLIALRRTELRGRTNLLAQERSVFCSAFARYLFQKAGVDLVAGVDVKNTTPGDIANTTLPHTAYVLLREVAKSRIDEARKRVRTRLKAEARRMGRKVRAMNLI